MDTANPSFARRGDLDALRAGAMLLGIVLHASLSFFPSFWMVSDSRQNSAFLPLFSLIHGFRMPLFFVMSGFFSAMLLHRRGRGALVKHRFFRVFLPLLAGMVTVVPATIWISGVALSGVSRKVEAPASTGKSSSLWEAAKRGDLDVIEQQLDHGVPIDGVGGEWNATPLITAALAGRTEAVERLLHRGAAVNAVAGDGATALQAAAFPGHEAVVAVLLQNGADVNAANKSGQTPLDSATLDEGTTRYIAGLIQLELPEEGLAQRKTKVADELRRHGALPGKPASLSNILMQMQLFSHLWFLWFLWWLVLGLAALSAIGSRLPAIRLPRWLVTSPARYAWLIPLTMVPQWFMGAEGTAGLFGPDTSAGLLPIPHVLAYYAIFFGFGAIYYGCHDTSGQVGQHGWLPLAIALLVVLPLGTSVNTAWPSFLGGIGPLPKRILGVALQAAYPWLMTFGLMGLFHRICPVENRTMRYLSDSSYWLYLVHLPLVIGAQYLVRDWPLPAVVKFLGIVVVVTAFLLGTYQAFVRYTWIGRFLNGPRVRPSRAKAMAPAASNV